MIHFGDLDPDDEVTHRPDDAPDAETIDAEYQQPNGEGIRGDPLKEELFEFSEAAERDQLERIAEYLAQRLEQQRAGAGSVAASPPTAEQIAATTGTVIVLGASSARGALVQALNVETGITRRAVISEQFVAGERQLAALLPKVPEGEWHLFDHRHFGTIDVLAGEATIVDWR